MDTLSNHIVDYIVLGTVLLSSIFAFARGFVRECLALISWIVATFVAMNFSDGLKKSLEPHIHSPLVQSIASKGIVFVCVLVVLSILSYFIARLVRASALSAVDRSLGFLFGAARGFLIVCLAYMLGTMLFPVREKPEWLKSARTEPLMAGGSTWLAGFIPPDEAETLKERLGADSAQDATAAASTLGLAGPTPAGASPTGGQPAADGSNPVSEIGRIEQQLQQQQTQPGPSTQAPAGQPALQPGQAPLTAPPPSQAGQPPAATPPIGTSIPSQ